MSSPEAHFPTAGEVANWPESDRRAPTRSDHHYLALAPLSDQLKAEIDRTLGDRVELRVLDVGCGDKPYLPFFAGRCRSYLGIDAVPGDRVDVVAPAEHLPCEDESVDVVICTQVLEHVDDPGQVLAEIHRVLAPGGVVLLSTHGVFLYHPDPPTSDRDYWRWTHAGLERIVRQSGEWDELRTQPQGNVIACLGYIIVQYADAVGGGLPFIGPLRRGLIHVVNAVAEWLDARFPPNARVPGPGSMSANYLVTGIKQSDLP